jgi:branched-chain amino acid transport system permease protein
MANLEVGDILQARKSYEAGITTTRGTDRPRWLPITLVAVLLVMPALQLVGGYNYVLHMALYTLMYVAMASSWNILGGFTGYISLGHPVFYCIGAYFSGLLLAYFGISTLVTAPLAGLVAAILGFLIGLITLKMRGPTFIISSIALLMVVRILFDNWDFVGGSNGVTLPKLDLTAQWIKLPYYYAFLVIAVVTVYVSYRIKHSKFGLHLRAISQDEVKAESAGIDTRLYKSAAFAISAFFVGVCGAVWGEYLTYIRPTLFLMLLIAVNMVLMCILGGKGTVAGPIVGAILIVAFNEASVAFFGASEINILGTGLIMVLTLMYFPNGIVGTLAQKRKLPRFLNWD